VAPSSISCAIARSISPSISSCEVKYSRATPIRAPRSAWLSSAAR
jgi:hypothetical protein